MQGRTSSASGPCPLSRGKQRGAVGFAWPATSVELALDARAGLATVTLSGPDGAWLGVGFGAKLMSAAEVDAAPDGSLTLEALRGRVLVMAKVAAQLTLAAPLSEPSRGHLAGISREPLPQEKCDIWKKCA